MAIAAELDWTLAKELWFKGLPADAISLQTGIKPVTIRKRASREKWALQKRPDTALATATKNVVLKELANRISTEAVEQSEALMATMRDLAKPSNYRECKDYATALSSTYATARKALGLDEQNANVSFSVTVINGGMGDVTRPVIDVTPDVTDVTEVETVDQPAGVTSQVPRTGDTPGDTVGTPVE